MLSEICKISFYIKLKIFLKYVIVHQHTNFLSSKKPPLNYKHSLKINYLQTEDMCFHFNCTIYYSKYNECKKLLLTENAKVKTSSKV